MSVSHDTVSKSMCVKAKSLFIYLKLTFYIFTMVLFPVNERIYLRGPEQNLRLKISLEYYSFALKKKKIQIYNEAENKQQQ